MDTGYKMIRVIKHGKSGVWFAVTASNVTNYDIGDLIMLEHIVRLEEMGFTVEVEL